MKKLLITITLVLCSSCALQDRIKGVSNRFLEDVNVKQSIDNIPFDHAWIKAGFDGGKYEKVYFEPVVLKIDEGKWVNSVTPITSTKEDYIKEVEIIAEYFLNEILKEFKEYPERRIKTVSEKAPDALTVKIALTELEFSHPSAQAASLASPVPGTGAALSAVSQAHMAMAIRVYTPEGQLVATGADRKFPPTRIVDLNQLTVTSANREIAQLWAETLAEVFHKGRLRKTDEKGVFSILPW